ncbi:MAG: type II secretion system protein GspH [Proteobacteria bacterium]|nr:MAG: type II secretion system protein GspH [Pseudomonadota bacterium]
MRSKTQGFSLLEVILVLVIAGLMMGVAASSLSEGPVLRKNSREVATSLRHARSLAILRQKEILWSMDTQTGHFGLPNEGEKRALHEGIVAKINTARSEVSSASRANIRFFPDGSSTGGSVDLMDGQQSYTVNVEWISGRVSLL